MPPGLASCLGFDGQIQVLSKKECALRREINHSLRTISV